MADETQPNETAEGTPFTPQDIRDAAAGPADRFIPRPPGAPTMKQERSQTSDDSVNGAAEPTPATGDDGPPGGAAEEAYSYVVAGKEKKVPRAVIDAAAAELGLDPKDLLQGGQLGRAGRERLRQAHEDAAEVMKFGQWLKTDPQAAMTFLAADEHFEFRKQVEVWLRKTYQAEDEVRGQTPEQRLVVENARLRKEADDRQRAEDGRKRAAEAEAAQREWVPKVEAQITDAIRLAGMPATPSFIKQVAMVVDRYWKAGVTDVTFADCVQEVRDGLAVQVKTIRSELKTIDDVRRVFGDDLLAQIRKLDVEGYQSAPPRETRRTGEPRPVPAGEKGGRMLTWEEAERQSEEAKAQFFGKRR